MHTKKSLIRWGIIGGGSVVETKSGPAINRIPKSLLQAIVRRDLNQAKVTASRLGAHSAYDNVNTLANDPLIDAVYIATPPGLHRDHALICCEAGKPTYIEKPLARSYSEALEIVTVFEQAKIPLFVAHYRRALPRFIELKSTVLSGVIGNPIEVDFRLNRQFIPSTVAGSNTWIYNPSLSGGGKFFDIAPHSIDLLIYLFGEFYSVNGYAINTNPAYDVEDIVVMSFRTSTGVLGTANFNLNSNEKTDYLQIRGTTGIIDMSVHGNAPIIIKGVNVRQEITTPNPVYIEEPMIELVTQYLLGFKTKPCTGRDALATAWVMDQVLSEYYCGRDDAFWERPTTWARNAWSKT